MRERAAVLYDQLSDKRAEEMNRHMLVLSVVAAVFLPLSLLTGLLGINVGGIPGASSQLGFLAVCILMVAILAFELWLFRRIRLI